MLKILADGNLRWDSSLAPLREGEIDKEKFSSWWERNDKALAHLHPQIAEQWIHRHWTLSPYCFLPLQDLTWKAETWPVDRLMSVYMPRCQFNAEHDYSVFNMHNARNGHPTSRAMNATGTWDYPVVLLHTPNGLRDYEGEFPEARYLLIEGHSRMRYLNALVARARGEAAAEHAVFVLCYAS